MMYLHSDFDKVSSAKRLVKYGFAKDKSKFAEYYAEKDKKKKHKLFLELEQRLSDNDWLAAADMEVAEITKNEMAPTGYPSPGKRHVMGIQDPNKGVLENSYFWMLGHMTDSMSFNQIYKITDSFAGSSQSSFFGAGSQRLSILQDRVSSTLQTIGTLVKDMFPQIHELHIWDERLGWYQRMKKGDKAADITLKGTWIDLIEGGTENASSVYGLAQKVGFAILPDLFFNTFVKSSDNVDKVVDTECKDFNKEVRNILKRKIFQYTKWREESEKEVITRRRFIVRYLRQHYNAIKMYMGWIKPYLKQLKYMQQNADFQARPEMVNSFEGSIMEVEILATKMKSSKYKPVALMNFYYTTKPELNMTDPTYQHRGPSHSGEVYVTMRSYAWTEEEIQNYRKMKDEEDFEFLQEIDGGLKAAMEELGEDLISYIEELGTEVLDEENMKKEIRNEAEEKAKKEKRNKIDIPNVYEPFGNIFGGIAELFGPLIPLSFEKKEKTPYEKKAKESKEQQSAAGAAKGVIGKVFKNYRKAHKMVTW